MGNNISLLSTFHHGKQCMPSFAAVRERGSKKDENDKEERSQDGMIKGENDTVERGKEVGGKEMKTTESR